MIFKLKNLLFSCALASTTVSVVAEEPAIMPQKHFKVFEKYCLECHDTDTQKGKLDMETLSFDMTKDIPTAEHWQNILDSINSGEMPPEKKTQISPEEKTAFLSDLSIQMVKARDILSDNGGEITMRRMNRREYTNSMESIFGFKPDVRSLPTDDGGAKFDTFGDSLFFSSDQFETYREIAKQTLSIALKELKDPPQAKVKRVDPENTISKMFKEIEGLHLDSYTRGKSFAALPKAEQTPKNAKKFGFEDVQQALKQFNRKYEKFERAKHYNDRPESKTGAIMVHYNRKNILSSNTIKVSPDKNILGGKYKVRIKAGCYPEVEERDRYLNFSITGPGRGNEFERGHVKVKGTLKDPQIVEFDFYKPFGVQSSLWVKQRVYEDRPSKLYVFEQAKKKNGFGLHASVWIDYIEVEGPFFDEGAFEQQSSLVPEQMTDEGESDYARRLVSTFAKKSLSW
ncbi:MAG: DUF1587 domain-containing protein [Lentisphaeraceae bacterium]|nr:DUF1587 domain-containing protein [Lentisphaeraceae bacterium]